MKKKLIIKAIKMPDALVYLIDETEVEGVLVSNLTEAQAKKYIKEYTKAFSLQFMEHWKIESKTK